MTKWEYLYARVENETVKYIDSQHAGKSILREFGIGGEHITDFLAGAGQEGWELVSISEGAGVWWRLIFKRPAQ